MAKTYDEWAEQAILAAACEQQVAERRQSEEDAAWVADWNKSCKPQVWITEAASSAYWNAQAAELAKELLLFKMEAYSKNYYAAGWAGDLEFLLWQKGGEWRKLAAIAEGWWCWGLGRDNRWFCPLNDWLEDYAEWESRQG